MLTYEYIHQESKSQVSTLQRQAEEMICQVVETGGFTDDPDSAWVKAVGPQVAVIEQQIMDIAQMTLETAQEEQAWYISQEIDASYGKEIDFIEFMVAYWLEQVELTADQMDKDEQARVAAI